MCNYLANDLAAFFQQRYLKIYRKLNIDKNSVKSWDVDLNDHVIEKLKNEFLPKKGKF